MKPINILYFPLSKLYETVTNIRNWLYDTKRLSTYRSKIKTIGVGNLTVGGTGKTPMVEFLTELFAKNHQTAILSRGYGRSTRGYGVANDTSTAQDIGDEPLQFYKKLGNTTPIVVCEKRAIGLQKIEAQFTNCQLVILDDVFQHRAVATDILILLTDYTRLFTDDFVLPYGRLRESRTGAKRADAVVVTKCPANISEIEMNHIKKEILIYTSADISIFFTKIVYQSPLPYFKNQPPFEAHTPSTLVSGIAQPMSFETAAKKQFSVKKHHIHKDHHSFVKADFKDIDPTTQVLTTEKDWVKIKALLDEQECLRFYYWPIKIQFISAGFEDWVVSRIRELT